LIFPRFGRIRPGRVRPLREQMIRETNAFLTWALRQKSHVPRIPTRPVTDVYFEALIRSERGKSVVNRWWDRTLGPMWPGARSQSGR